MNNLERLNLLIDVLLDREARVDERDDAAMDLGQYDDDRALETLLTIVLDPHEEPFIMDVCGESIAKIWRRRNIFDKDILSRMNANAKYEIEQYILKSSNDSDDNLGSPTNKEL